MTENWFSIYLIARFANSICSPSLFFLIKLPPFIKSKSFMQQFFFSLRSPYANLALISVCCNRSKWHRISVSIRFSSTFYLKNGISLHQLHTNFILKFTNHFGFSHTCTWNFGFFFQHCNSLAFVHSWFVIQWNMRICEALKHSNFRSTHTSIDKMYWMFAFNIMEDLLRSYVTFRAHRDLKVRWGQFQVQNE